MMSKYTFYIIIYFITALLFSCSPIDNQKKVELKSEVSRLIPVDSIMIDTGTSAFFPFDIIDIESGYIVQTQRSPVGFIRVFDATGRKYLYDWGSPGKGPGEFSMPPFFMNVIGEELILSDVMDFSQEYFMVTDTALIHQKSASLRYDGQPSLLERIVWYGEDLYLADNHPVEPSDQSEYILLEIDNDQIRNAFGAYPVQDMSPDQKSSRFLKTTAIHPEDKKIMSFYMRYNAFKQYNDMNEDGLTLIDEFRIEDFSVDPGDHISRLVQDWSAGQIGTLGIHNSSTDIYDQMKEGMVTYYEAWDWNGNHQYRAPFDRMIHGFTISYDRAEIYAYSLTDPAKLLIYELPGDR